MLKKIEHDSIKIHKCEYDYLQTFYNSELAMDPKIISIYNNRLNLSVYLSYKSKYNQNLYRLSMRKKSYSG